MRYPILLILLILVLSGISALFLLAPARASAAPAATPTIPDEPAGEARTFTVDPVHSSVLFRVKHLDVTPFYGRFNAFEGTFRLDGKDMSRSFVEMKVDAASVDSANEARDRHLKSQDFFSVKEFPKITFKSKSIEKAGEGRYRVKGDLVYRGVTRSVAFEASHTGSGEVNPRFGFRSGFEAIFTFKRSDFGDTYGVKDKVLGDEVRLIIALEGTTES